LTPGAAPRKVRPVVQCRGLNVKNYDAPDTAKSSKKNERNLIRKVHEVMGERTSFPGKTHPEKYRRSPKHD